MVIENEVKPIPFFSIVIPTLNEEKFLPTLLSDLKNQTYKDFEVIIVDAKSVDKTVKKAEEFKDKFTNLTILTSDKKNVSYQRNLGTKNAIADWLVFMDADNRLPFYFLQGIKFRLEMLQPNILSTWIEPDTNNKRDKATTLLINIYIDIQKNTNKPRILEAMLCIKKNSFLKLKGFNEKLLVNEGSDLLSRALKKKMKFYFVKDPKYICSFRRVRTEGVLKTIRNTAQIEMARLSNIHISKEKLKYLYPMDGGMYFELDKNTGSRIEKLIYKIFKYEASIKREKEKLIGKVFRMLKKGNT